MVTIMEQIMVSLMGTLKDPIHIGPALQDPTWTMPTQGETGL